MELELLQSYRPDQLDLEVRRVHAEWPYSVQQCRRTTMNRRICSMELRVHFRSILRFRTIGADISEKEMQAPAGVVGRRKAAFAGAQ